MIRIGRSLRDQASDVDSKGDPLGDYIDKLIGGLGGWAKTAPLTDRLQYRLLCAEFEYLFGRHASAASDLNALVDELKLREALKEFSHPTRQNGRSTKRDHFADPDDSVLLLRRKIWALMGALFYFHYSVKGDVVSTIQELNDLLNVVNGELKKRTRAAAAKRLSRRAISMAADYEPHGTRLQICLCLAQIHRTKFGLARAAELFDQARDESEKRLGRELRELRDAVDLRDQERADRRADEVQFSVATTVRILGGLGRLATIEGRLEEARQLFRTCLTLLAPTGQIPLKRVLQSHLTIVERRAAPSGTVAWDKAIARLKTLFFEDFINDVDGRRRCAQDLARAYLELAESDMIPEVRERSLGLADEWIGALRTLGGSRKTKGRAERYRAFLLEARRRLLTTPADIAGAEKAVEAARLEADGHPECGLDLQGFDHVRDGLTTALVLHVKSLQTRDKLLQEDADLKLFDEAVHKWRTLIDESRDKGDRVLECEAWLRLAQLQSAQQWIGDAHESLREGDRLADMLENAALSELRDRSLRSAKDIFIIPPDVTFPVASEALREKMVLRLWGRTKNYAGVSDKLKIGAATVEAIVKKRR